MLRSGLVLSRSAAARTARPQARLMSRWFSSAPKQEGSSPSPGGGGAAGSHSGGGGGGTGGGGEQAGPKNAGIGTFGPLALFLGGAGAYWNIQRYQQEEARKAQEGGSEGDAASVKQEGGTGKPSLGGSWRLMDHHAKYVTDKDFLGQWQLLYFGFTYCPDICPNELIRMREILDTLDKDPGTREKVLPLFITIDPKRDGPAQLKSYLSDWHPRLLGLTGQQEECDDAAKAFRVYWSKSQLGPDPMDYLIDHSVMFYLVDPKGGFVDYYAPNASPGQISERIAKAIKGFK